MVMHVGGIGGRTEEWWRAPAQRSWSGGELGGGGLGGRSERSVQAVVLGGQGSAMGSMKRRTQRGSLRH
jgi:hypothetical protein